MVTTCHGSALLCSMTRKATYRPRGATAVADQAHRKVVRRAAQKLGIGYKRLVNGLAWANIRMSDRQLAALADKSPEEFEKLVRTAAKMPKQVVASARSPQRRIRTGKELEVYRGSDSPLRPEFSGDVNAADIALRIRERRDSRNFNQSARIGALNGAMQDILALKYRDLLESLKPGDEISLYLGGMPTRKTQASLRSALEKACGAYGISLVLEDETWGSWWGSFKALLARHLNEDDVEILKEGGELFTTGKRRAETQLTQARAAVSLMGALNAAPGDVILLTPAYLAVKIGTFSGVRPLTRGEVEAYKRGALGVVSRSSEQARMFYDEGLAAIPSRT